MRRDFFFILLLIIGGIAIACDLAFTIYLGITLSSVLGGIAFLPAIFSTLCTALAIINGVAIVYSILYILVLRK